VVKLKNKHVFSGRCQFRFEGKALLQTLCALSGVRSSLSITEESADDDSIKEVLLSIDLNRSDRSGYSAGLYSPPSGASP